MILTTAGLPIATKYTRLVRGERGTYAEFSYDQLIHENMLIPQDQKWRFAKTWPDPDFR